MLVLNTATSAKAEGKGIEGAEGEGGVTLSGSMTRQVSFYWPQVNLPRMKLIP